jgi:PAS domain S-box-containing protein
MRRKEKVANPLSDYLPKVSIKDMAEASITYRRALLEAGNEAFPDGVLVVDPNGKMVAYNQHFVQIWHMPQAILDAGDDSAALRHAMSLVEDSRKFIHKVESAYAGTPSDVYLKDVIPFKDGRVIERHGKAVMGAEGIRYGWAWYFRDITEQYRTYQELEKQRNRFRNTLEGMSDAFISLDNNWNILFANTKAAAFGQVVRDEILGKSIWKAFPALENTPVQKLIQTCMEGRKPARLDYGALSDGQSYSIKVYPSDDEISIFIKDITDKKKSEEERRKSEKQYRSFANSLPQLAWMAHADGWIHWYNERWYDYTGTTLEEMQGWGWEKVQHPEHIGRVLAFVKEAWKEDQPWEITFPLRRWDGVFRWFLTRVYPAKDETGAVQYWIGTSTDINDQLESEKALKQSETQLKRLANFMPQIVWATDPEGNHDFFNKRWYEFTGLTFLQTKNAGWSLVLHPEDVDRTMKVWQHSLQTGERYETEYRMRRHDGEYRWLLARAMPLRDASGRIDRWFGTCTDIHDQRLLADTLETKVKERTRDLQEANNHLKRINEELRQFTYIASHDLQEPIRKIKVFSDRIQKQDYDNLREPSRIALDRIIQSADHLSILFKDLMDFIGIQREMIFTCVNLNDVIDNVENDLELLIWERKATIQKVPLPTIKAIPLQIYRLFYNLISNALKFSSKDKAPLVQITCEELAASEVQVYELLPEQKYYYFKIKDNGIGFEQEFADRIFVLFKRLHSQHTFGGTGVGLALCKKVTDNHYGRIWAESEPGLGATFHLILPEVTYV